MAINVGDRTVTVLKKLASLSISRDLTRDELLIMYQYATGFVDNDGSFKDVDSNLTKHKDEYSRWILQRTVSQAGLDASATLAQFLVTVFDALESGSVNLPDLPEASISVDTDSLPSSGGNVDLTWSAANVDSVLVESAEGLAGFPYTTLTGTQTVAIPGTPGMYTFTITTSGPSWANARVENAQVEVSA